MIVEELAYKVTVKTEEFVTGKRKIKEEAKDLKSAIEGLSEAIDRSTAASMAKTKKETDKATDAFKGLNKAFSGFLGLTTRFVAVGGVMTAVAVGIHKAFESSAESIVRASNIGRILGTGASNVLGTQYGFSRIGQNGGAFLSAQLNAKMALANLQDPTIFGGLTGEAQNLLTLGARTGIDINKLGGSSTSALKEFQKYGKDHTKDQLMQVLAGFGYDPNLAGDIKSGKAVQMVSEEEKQWKLTKEQEEAQRKILETTRALDSQFALVKQELMATFGPEVLKAEQEFLAWLKDNKGDIVDFFRGAGKAVSEFTKSVGGATEAVAILALLRSGPKGIAIAGAYLFGKKAYDDLSDPDYEVKRAKPAPEVDQIEGIAGKAWNFLTGWMGSANAGSMPPNIVGGNGFDMGRMLDSIRQIESSGGKRLFSPAGAVGEYQLMRGTATDMGLSVGNGIDERLDPQKSRAAASLYMSKMLKMFDGNIEDALTAYNWGPGNTRKWIDQGRGDGFINGRGEFVKRPLESLQYAGKVMDDYNMRGMQHGMPPYAGGSSTVINTHIQKVEVNQADASTVDSLARSANNQLARASTNQAFSSAVRG
ncbi:lytic transglycosylase domain-containing protein [Edwardsiella piscicida]|uniref:lytic transglycosylase domain-containing protein n=1 Tax=Edwardsiella piscicida TaxID=1263550 RepID=UPI000D505EE3|nr:lytic transglycosylase domain-containing protein [Edwardsiella piscicida]EKS7766372.1 lytic transglycosylase domain-containing protein [Edwardsiella piscicida]UCQ43787.1 lytic transglycosylase domain-containing protein [Edwardsiella piscicida]